MNLDIVHDYNLPSVAIRSGGSAETPTARIIIQFATSCLALENQQRGFLPSDASIHTPDSFAIMSDFESRLDYREKDGIMDYKLIISCRLFANGKMVLQDKPYDDPLRYTFDDLALVENCFDKLVRTYLKMDGFPYGVTSEADARTF